MKTISRPLSLLFLTSVLCRAEEPTLLFDPLPEPLKLPPGLEQTLPLDKTGSIFGDAFRVVLTSRDGALEVGENALLVRVGFHDPEDPLAPGVGIPEARVQLSAWMPLDEGSSEAVSLHYAGDGQYLLDPVELDRPGIWQLDLEVDVGATMRENVSFTFLVEG